MHTTRIGKGSQGEVRKAIHYKTKETRAVKIIDKALLGKNNWKMIQNEIEILSSLDHPNIVKIYEYFETKENFYIVMELIKGKPLFKQIKKLRGKERVIANIIHQLLLALNYLRKRSIVHMDLKSENILWCGGEIKLIDFGLSGVLENKTPMKKLMGTRVYIAPEVINENYGVECDVWSAGVILFILLTGKLPFDGKEEKEIFGNILNQKFRVDLDKTKKVSPEGKSLVREMMTYCPKSRPSPEELLKHPFLDKRDRPKINADVLRVIESLHQYRIHNKLQERIFYYFVNHCISSSELKQVRRTFEFLDQNGDGELSRSELGDGLVRINPDLNNDQLNCLFDLMDVNSDGTISYTEFVAAAFDKDKLLDEKRIDTFFSTILQNGQSKAGVEDFQALFGNVENCSVKDIEKGIRKFDTNHDGKLNLMEFGEMMKGLICKKKTKQEERPKGKGKCKGKRKNARKSAQRKGRKRERPSSTRENSLRKENDRLVGLVVAFKPAQKV